MIACSFRVTNVDVKKKVLAGIEPEISEQKTKVVEQSKGLAELLLARDTLYTC